MGDNSKIEWTDATWNPVTGCTKVSAGCQHCYAERQVSRFGHGRVHQGLRVGPAKFSDVVLHPDRLDHPFHWRTPRRIFVCSMGDLFHESVPLDFVGRVWSAMLSCPHHTFQILTKRPQRMHDIVLRFAHEIADKGLMDASNVWLGVSVENQATADERIPLLLQTPAAVRWVSVEPMLGPADMGPWMDKCSYYCDHDYTIGPYGHRPERSLLDWIVCGGESGPQARPMELAWARSLRDQCVSAGVPFLFKQWGQWCPPSQMPEHTFQAWDVHHGTENGINRDAPWRCGKRAAGRLLDGREWNEFPK